MGRFILEGEWTGYVSRQAKIVHRTVHNDSERKFKAWAKKTNSIRYTDGTCLILSMRDCKPRERVAVINGYNSLIKDCFYKNVDSVAALKEAK